MHRRAGLACLLLLFATAACSDDESSTTSAAPTTAEPATIAPGATNPFTGDSLAPQTTFMPDCSRMPEVADLTAAVGIPMDAGQVTAPTTCQFLGLNDQSRSITLTIFTDGADIAAFNDLQASLGTSAPSTDPELAGALVGPEFALYITANSALYIVQTRVTDGDLAGEIAPASAILKRWLTL